jgi:hypothetical protein
MKNVFEIIYFCNAIGRNTFSFIFLHVCDKEYYKAKVKGISLRILKLIQRGSEFAILL